MATTQTQLRRGTNAQVNAMTPAEGEVVVDMTNDRLNVGDGIRSGGYPVPNFSDVQKNTFGYAVAGGTANAITLTLSPALLAYVEGVEIDFKATADNSDATTVNVNGLGAVSLRNQDVSLLVGGELVSGRNYKLTYNGTQFILMNAASSGSILQSGLVFLGTRSVSSGTIDFTSLMDDSLYSEYKIAFRGIAFSATTSLRLRVSVNNGSSYISSAYSSSSDADAVSTSAPSLDSAILTGNVTSTAELSGEVNIYNASLATSASWDTQSNSRSISGVVNRSRKFGVITNSAAINAARLLVNVGAITAGTATLYGYAK